VAERRRPVVVGAGAAGLCAARTLRAAGWAPSVLEAADRAGGRIHTVRAGLAPGQFAELGAMRFADGHALVWECVNRYGLRAAPFTMHDPTGLACFAGRVHRWADVEAGGVELIPDAGPAPTSTEWKAGFHKVCGLTPEAGIDWLEVERRVGGVAFDEAMRSIGWSDGRIHSFVLCHGFETRMGDSFLRVARDIVIKTSQRLWRLTDGMDGMVAGLLSEVPDVRYGAHVVAVEQGHHGVRVTYRGLGGEQSLDGGAAVIAVSAPAVDRIAFSPPLSPGKQAAIRQLAYDPSVKTGVQVRGRRWSVRDGVRAGVSLTDLPIRNVHYPEPNDSDAVCDDRSVLVVGYAWGEDAQRLGTLSDAERLRLMVSNLAVLHPGIEQDVEVGVTKVWQTDPLIGGAFPIYQPGERGLESRRRISSPEGRVFFAGEHTDADHGWVEGALASGLRAAEEIGAADSI
jgi:monoamine oxidase